MSETIEPPPDPAAWQGHTCVRCGEAFMLPSGAEDDARAACPHCGAPAILTTKHSDPGNFAPLTTPRGRQKRTRRKRKVHTEEDLAWEAQATETEKQGQISEFLTRTTRFPGKVRLKRVRRKKLPGRWEKLSAKLGVWSIAALVVTGAALIYVAIHNLFIVAATDTDPSQRPDADLGPAVETLDDDGVPTIVTPEERAACVTLGNAFYAAKTVEEKLLHVRQPQRVRPLMERWYRLRSRTDDQISEVIHDKKRTVGGRRFISLAVEFAGGSQRIISFEQAAGGAAVMKLDWEVSVGYQPMPLAEFRDAKPTTATPFRVKVKNGDDYRAPFEDREKYQCVRLTNPGDREFQLTGYIDRDAPWAAGFLARLEFGAPSVILGLKFPEGADSNAHVEVAELVHESWYY